MGKRHSIPSRPASVSPPFLLRDHLNIRVMHISEKLKLDCGWNCFHIGAPRQFDDGKICIGGVRKLWSHSLTPPVLGLVAGSCRLCAVTATDDWYFSRIACNKYL